MYEVKDGDKMSSVTVIEENGIERQLIYCDCCEYLHKIENKIDYCKFCKSTALENIHTRIHVPQIKILRMNKRIKEKYGRPIYAMG